MCRLGADKVSEEKEVEEYALSAEDHRSEKGRGLFDRHERSEERTRKKG